MKKIPGVVDRFLVRKISLSERHRNRYVRVLLFDTRGNLSRYYNICGETKGKSATYGFFYKQEDRKSGSIGDICVWIGSRIVARVLLHESYHAAFYLASLHGFKNDGYFPPQEYEEFVVRGGEFIAYEVLHKLRKRSKKPKAVRSKTEVR